MSDLIERQAAIKTPLSASFENHDEIKSYSKDTISRQAAIDICDNVIDSFRGQFGAGVLVAIKESIEELPPAQPEQTNCDYCHEDVDGYVKPIEKNGHAFVRFGMNGWELELKAKGWHGEVKIQYCPMCGRKL